MFGLISSLGREYIVQYCILLTELQISAYCDSIRDGVLIIVRQNAYRERAYFSEEKIDTYLQAKQQRNYAALSSIPSTVIIIYDFIETLQVVSKTFNDIAALRISNDVLSIALLSNAICLLWNDFPVIYARLQNLSNSNKGMHTLLAPFFEQVSKIIHDAAIYAQSVVAAKDDIFEKNKDKLRILMPATNSGLAMFSRSVVLAPFLLKELTELIERIDSRIDFDPNSDEILRLEKQLYSHLNGISASRVSRGFLPLIQSAPILFKAIKAILNAAADVTKESHNKCMQLYKNIDETILPDIQSSLEKFEEENGLTAGVLSFYFEREAYRLLAQLRINLESFGKIPEFTRQVAEHANHPMKSATKYMTSLLNVNKLLGRTQKNQDESLRDAANLSPSAMDALVAVNHSNGYMQKVYLTRVDRYTQVQASINIEDIIERNVHDFFNMIAAYNRPFGNKTLQGLPETAKGELKKHYSLIQHLIASISSQLDIDITTGLNSATLIPTTYSIVRDNALSIESLTGLIMFFLIMRHSWNYQLALTLTLVICVTSLLRQHSNQLQKIIACKDSVLTLARQQKATDVCTKQQIIQRFARDCGNTDLAVIESALQTSLVKSNIQSIVKLTTNKNALHLEAVGNKFMYKNLFGQLSELKYSASIATFESTILYRVIYDLLLEQDRLRCFTNNNRDALEPKVPFTEFYEDEKHLLPYKKLMNGFYKLKLCLRDLEQVCMLGEPAVWNIPGQVNLSIKILLPILGIGLQGYFDIINALNNPITANIAQRGLECLIGLDSLIPLFASLKQAPLANTAAPFNARDAWQLQQQKYASLLNKEPLIIDIAQQAAAVAAEPVVKEQAEITIHTVSLWLAEFVERVQLTHSNTFTNNNLTLDITANAKTAIETFFGKIKLHVANLHYHNETLLIIDKIYNLTISDAKQDSPREEKTVHLLEEIQHTLQFIEHMKSVFKNVVTETTPNFIKNLQMLYDILAYQLLSAADDMELELRVQHGLISNVLQDYLSTVFISIQQQYDSQGKIILQFLTNQTWVRLRKDRLLTKCRQLIENSKENNIGVVPANVSGALLRIKILLEKIKNNRAPLIYNYYFNNFLDQYQILQDILFKCDSKFNRDYFLRSIIYNKKDTLLNAITTIIQAEDKIINWYASQKNNMIEQAEYLIGKFLYVDTVQQNNSISAIIKLTIQEALKKLYACDIGCYLPLLQELISHTILTTINVQDWRHIQLDDKSIDSYIQNFITNTMQPFIESNDLLKELILILIELHQYNTLLAKQVEDFTPNDVGYNYVFSIEVLDIRLMKKNVLYLTFDNNNVTYKTLDPNGSIVEGTFDADFLQRNAITVDTNLTQHDLDNLFTPKILDFIEETNKRGHTIATNPVVVEMIEYIRTLNTEVALDGVKDIFIKNNTEDLTTFCNSIRSQVTDLLTERAIKLENYSKLAKVYDILNKLDDIYVTLNQKLNANVIGTLKQIIRDTPPLDMAKCWISLKETLDPFRRISSCKTSVSFVPSSREKHTPNALLEELSRIIETSYAKFVATSAQIGL